MKIISYSLFGYKDRPPERLWEWYYYLRGLYFNVRMNKLIYPGFRTHVEVDSETFSAFDNIFLDLRNYYGLSYNINNKASLCKSMLWRLKMAFHPEVIPEYIFCRDLDAITTYREAQAVQAFINSGEDVHVITDNPAHTTPMMGGMIGMKGTVLREMFSSWEEMIATSDITIATHGTDQSFMQRALYPKLKQRIFAHYLDGMKGNGEKVVSNTIWPELDVPGVHPKLWESNLCCRFIGSPGAVDMEVLRFFERFDEPTGFEETAKRYKEIFYWYL